MLIPSVAAASFHSRQPCLPHGNLLSPPAEPRLIEQMARGMMLVYLDRGVLPEAVAVILSPSGGGGREPTSRLRSPRGLSRCELGWHVVRLWDLSADELFAAGDVGLIRWIPLTGSTDSPESVLDRCRETVENDAPPD